MLKKRNIVTLLICLLLLTAVALSFGMLLRHAGHSCNNESCPVCVGIDLCKGLLRSLALAAVAVCLPFIIACRFFASGFVSLTICKAETPVTLKTKLLN